MLKARFIIVGLICAAPVILLWDGPVVQGLVAGVVAAALAVIARTLRPGETEFLVSVIRPAAAVMAVPALWILIQVLPLRALAHPIWTSAETALRHPIIGSISVDPGASIIALGQYLSLTAIGFVSAAVAVDRQRAEWVLFALTAACTAAALILLTHEVFGFGDDPVVSTPAPAVVCAAMGVIITGAACIRTFERYQTRHTSPPRSVATVLSTLAASSGALVICVAALVLEGTAAVLVATGCGIAAFASVMVIRRFGLWALSIAAVAAVVTAVIILPVVAPAGEPGRSVLLMFATSATATDQAMLADAPLVGTGAGTFASLAPIYRGPNNSPSDIAPTAAAAIAIELGRPMLWLMAAAAVVAIVILLRASLRRGRNSFYSAMGGSCLVTLLLLAFINAGLLTIGAGLVAAAALGLALAQSKSRNARR